MTNFYLVKINPMAFLRLCLSTLLLLMMTCSVLTAGEYPETSGGWDKYENNPVLGGDLGTCFDVTMLHEDGLYQMWFSWRPRKSIAYTESRDGINWKEPVIVLGPRRGWESDLNRPGIIKKDGLYHLWYTGQANGRSNLGYATSEDGMDWERKSNTPVLIPEEPWEKVAVMCPHVEWDAQEQIFKMWYSGGEQYEPNAIGYATSKDGLSWDKCENNPIFIADKKSPWEQHKVTAAQVFKHDDWYLMFYIGFEDEDHARIGVARSRDGITNWQRHPTNPIIAPTLEKWDHDACYKPFVLFDHEEKKWRLWYNGRRGGSEQIGFAWHDGEDLGFPDEEEEETVKKTGILQPEQFKHYIDTFNNDDNELIVQAFPNDVAWNFLSANIPFLDYPDKNIEKTYYFRWWTFRKHLKKTDAGFVITEFQPPVPWAGKENTISCPGGHHFREGRWLHDPQFLNDYAVFWLRGGGALRSYSFWIADSIWKRALVTGDFSLAENLLPDLVRNHEAWERERLDPNGLFWQIDDRDGMEVSIGGSGYRATINSYMFGDALAISCIAARKGEDDLANKYYEKAITLKRLINENLWDQKAGFYKVAKRNDNRELPLQLADVRELHGYTPWYFDAIIPQPEYGVAWSQLTDPEGFFAPFGPTTAEQRHPGFKISYEGHECQWNGPSWPFATSMTLTSLANFIEKEKTANPEADISELQSAYLETLGIYARSHRIKNESMKEIAWIDENLNPFTGDWISRTRLKTWNNGTWDRGKGGVERGKDYNHSTFCDLVINGLIGFKPTVDDSFRIFPMVPDSVEFFCLDHLLWHGKIVTIFYDRTGERYHRGKGFNVYLDGKEVMTSENIPLTPVVVTWREYNK